MSISKVLVLVFALLVVSCSQPSEDQRLSDVKTSISVADNKSAIIELKAFLQQFPGNLEAREKLGSLLFDIGDLAGAESQFQRIVDNNISSPVSLKLHVALYHQRKYESILLLGKESDKDLQPYTTLLKYLAARQFRSGEYQALVNAQQYSNAISAKLLRAYEAYFNKEFSVALEVLPSQTDIPDDLKVEYWLLTSRLNKAVGQHEEAAEFAGKAYAYWQNVPVVAANAIELDLISRNFSEAQSKLERWRNILPESVWVNYFFGILESEKQNFTKALNFFEAAINNGLDTGDVWLLHGIAASQLKLWETAYTSFELSYARTKNNLALSLLAETQMQLGETEQSISTIKKVIEADRKLSSAYVERAVSFLDYKGLGGSAVDLYESYLSSNSSELSRNTENIIKLEILKSKNGLPLASQNIQLLIEKKPDSPITQYLAIKELLDSGNVDKARKAGEKLVKKYGPASADLLALIEMQDKNFVLASKYAQDKLRVVPGDKLSRRILVFSYHQSGLYELAFEQAKEIAITFPLDRQASIDAIGLLNLINDDELTKRFEEELIQLGEKSELISDYALLLLRNKSVDKAISFLDNKKDKLTTSGYQLLVRLLLEKNSFEQASEVTDFWLIESNTSKSAAIAKIGVFIAQGKYDEAQELGDKISKLFVKDPRIDVILYQMHKNRGQYKSALISIENMIEKSVPKSLSELFKGELAASQNKFIDAEKHLKISHSVNPTYLTTISLTQLLIKNGRINQAKEVMIEGYEKLKLAEEKHFHSFAEFFAKFDEKLKSISVYKDMLALEMESPVVYANMGSVYYEMRDMANAVESAAVAAESLKSKYVIQYVKYLYEAESQAGAKESLGSFFAKNPIKEEMAIIIAEAAVQQSLFDFARWLELMYRSSDSKFKKRWDALLLN